MKTLVLLLQMILTFDPYSVRTVEYRPQDCKQLEDGRVAYKQVRLTFTKMVLMQPSEVNSPQISSPAPVMHPDASKGIFSYRPADCKPMHDIKQHYVCVDKNWSRQPPTIFWTPGKEQ